MNEDIAYSIGLIGGDGSLISSDKENSLHIVDCSYDFHKNVISPLFLRIFKKEPKISSMTTKLRRITYRSRFRDKEIVRYYLAFLPSKNKTYEMRTPLEIMNGGERIKIGYLRGWMDAEGSVTSTKTVRKSKIYVYPKITFQVANECIRNELTSIMSQLGIHFTIWDYKNMRGFQIVGKHTRKYFDLVDFLHPEKTSRTRPNAAYSGWNNGLQLRKEELIP